VCTHARKQTTRTQSVNNMLVILDNHGIDHSTLKQMYQDPWTCTALEVALAPAMKILVPLLLA
jgi:hypothetical protein